MPKSISYTLFSSIVINERIITASRRRDSLATLVGDGLRAGDSSAVPKYLGKLTPSIPQAEPIHSILNELINKRNLPRLMSNQTAYRFDILSCL